MGNLRLIVGLGNPGEKYANTRHNLGFLAVNAFARKHNLSFQRSVRFKGQGAEGYVNAIPVHLLLPSTYMNLSGEAVKKKVAFNKLHLHELIIVVDDVNLKFGTLRIRPEGSTGGHNGLLSIENELHSRKYPRLRIGIGSEGANKEQSLEDYVLGEFNQEEKERLPSILDKAVSVLECWMTFGIEAAMQMAGDVK